METKKSIGRRYKIIEGCNGCGSCKVVCPVHCISKGTSYKINGIKCIGCGKCKVRCRQKLIVVDR